MEDLVEGGAAVPEEKKAYQRIYHAALEAKLSTGTVHVYVLTPDGKPMDTIHVAHADTKKVLEVLRKAIDRLQVPAGKALVAPAPQSKPPGGAPGSLIVHLTARSLDGKGCWTETPSEDWIVLGEAEWKKLLPPPGAALEDTWGIDQDVSGKLYRHFYPNSENNDVSKNEIVRQALEARLISVKDGVAMVRLEGSLRMKHFFYHKKDDGLVEAGVAGFLEIDLDSRRIHTLRMVAESAKYNGGTFGVAVRSVP
jgi:hypothetical protein